ncbi:DUF1707 and DUF4190 domain-containing protein [Kitasatospora cinereorecta]|uniref:DUF1707 and DUF4190 domain-containing protein n=1 Tax=Kitasatospora cinereorecta TaxID=285560 RepID=A0ABW0V7Q8_9ACTN
MTVQPPWGQQPSPYGSPWQPAHTPQSAMRAAHTDRERTVDVLKAAYAEGRLTAEEYSQRFDAAHRAQTYGQLAHLVADLPAGPMVAPFGAAVPVVPPAFGPPPFGPVPVRRRMNGLALGSMLLGVLCVPTFGATALPAVVTGHVARAQLRARGQDEEGDRMAVVGLVLGWISIGAWAALFLLAIVAGASGP